MLVAPPYVWDATVTDLEHMLVFIRTVSFALYLISKLAKVSKNVQYIKY